MTTETVELPPPVFTKNNGWHDSFTLEEAVSSVALEGEDLRDCLKGLACMVAAMLEKMPPKEQVRVLNAGSRYTWRIE